MKCYSSATQVYSGLCSKHCGKAPAVVAGAQVAAREPLPGEVQAHLAVAEGPATPRRTALPLPDAARRILRGGLF